MLYFAFVRSELQYASLAWAPVTITDSNKLDRTQRKFAALYGNRLFQDMQYHSDSVLERLNLLKLHNRRRYFVALLLINIFSALNVAPLSLI
jgi:hypothetical protein